MRDGCPIESVATPWHGSCSGPGQCAGRTANSGCSLGKVLLCQSSLKVVSPCSEVPGRSFPEVALRKESEVDQ